MKKIGLVIIIVFSSLNSWAQISQGEIKRETVRSHIEYLCSDELKGREIGTRGDTLAAYYLRDQLAQLKGFNLLGNNGVQPFQEHHITKLLCDCFYGEEKLKFMGFAHHSKVKGEFKGKVVFLGFGLKEDFKKVDVKGKWVTILDRTPECKMGPEELCNIYEKEKYAISQGALGVIIMPCKGYKESSSDQYGKVRKAVHYPILVGFIPTIQINITDFEAKHLHGEPYDCFEYEKEFKAIIDCSYNDKNTFNVSAIIKGNDKRYRNEVLVIGAHYDHLGEDQRNGGYCVGADDNASGVSALLEIARILSENRKSLKRSVVVVFFGAEETGILGSKFFKAYPLYKEKDLCMINLDMIGRMEEQTVMYGSERLVDRNKLLEGLTLQGTELRITDFIKGDTDHSTYINDGVPGFGIITSKHKDYHTSGDVITKLNFDGILAIGSYWLNVIERLVVDCYKVEFKEKIKK